MSVRVGIDLVVVDDVARSLAEHGDRYLERLLTPAERDYCSMERADPDPQRVAARLAAKEATVKVLRAFVPWRDVEVLRHPEGWVELALHGAAAVRAVSAGLSGFAVSLSHEFAYATAVVIAEVAPTGRECLHEAEDPYGR